VDVIAPIFAWIESNECWINFPPINWYSDDIQCYDLQETGASTISRGLMSTTLGVRPAGHFKPMELEASKPPLDTRKQARTRGTVVQEQLRNWAWWLAGYVGPPVQDKAASCGRVTMFQTKYGTDTIPNTSQTSLRARGWRKLLETCLHFRAWFSKPPTSNIPTILNTLLHSVLKSPQTGTSPSLKKRTNWLPNR
jgi:hypothetical protein